ncbi:MAG TPA: hypothetical protein VJ488_06355 [Dehalococcoidia bacterium]|nr:hypothetical protein [Dehalococcoidia bacterium]
MLIALTAVDKMLNSIKDANLRSLQMLENLYEKAAPIIRRIANLDTLNYGELPVSPYALVESNLTLRMVLNTLKKMPDPRDKLLASIQKELETAIINCIKAAEASEKYGEMGGVRSDRSRALLSAVINSTVMAHEYIESAGQKLEKTPVELISTIAEIDAKEPSQNQEKRWKAIPVKEVPDGAASVQQGVDKVAGGIETGLDKLGDIITFPIELIVKALRFISRR